jgi:hypothetical protein
MTANDARVLSPGAWLMGELGEGDHGGEWG